MSKPWDRTARRIDAMSLRERVVLFSAVALVMLALLDQFAMSPTLVQQRQRGAKLQAEADVLSSLRTRLAAAATPTANLAASASPEARLRGAIAQATATKTALDQQLARSQAERGSPVRLPDLLERTLQRHARLTLVSLASGGGSPAEAAATSPIPSASAVAAPAALAGVSWQGADLSVSGSYPDLAQFVAALEQGLPGLRWGELRLRTDHSPPVLSLHLWLAGEPTP